jgi:hypothetical protein
VSKGPIEDNETLIPFETGAFRKKSKGILSNHK